MALIQKAFPNNKKDSPKISEDITQSQVKSTPNTINRRLKTTEKTTEVEDIMYTI